MACVRLPVSKSRSNYWSNSAHIWHAGSSNIGIYVFQNSNQISNGRRTFANYVNKLTIVTNHVCYQCKIRYSNNYLKIQHLA